MSRGPPSLRFAGGAGTVTGSKYVLCTGNRQVLLECGLCQGLKSLRLSLFRRPPRATYVVHGEPEAAESLAQLVRARLGWQVEVASDGGIVPLA